MKPEDVSGWAPEVGRGTLLEQPANHREEISLSWKNRRAMESRQQWNI